MPDVTLIQQMRDWGYEVADEPRGVGAAQTATITGPTLAPIHCILRITENLCNAGLAIGIFDVVPQRSRYSLLVSLLELEWDHPLARVGLVNTPLPKNNHEKVGEGDINQGAMIRVIVAETTFVWTNLAREYFDARMKGVYAIALAASEHLAARASLSNTNPFFDRLRGATSPLAREDFPPHSAHT